MTVAAWPISTTTAAAEPPLLFQVVLRSHLAAVSLAANTSCTVSVNVTSHARLATDTNRSSKLNAAGRSHCQCQPRHRRHHPGNHPEPGSRHGEPRHANYPHGHLHHHCRSSGADGEYELLCGATLLGPAALAVTTRHLHLYRDGTFPTAVVRKISSRLIREIAPISRTAPPGSQPTLSPTTYGSAIRIIRRCFLGYGVPYPLSPELGSGSAAWH